MKTIDQINFDISEVRREAGGNPSSSDRVRIAMMVNAIDYVRFASPSEATVRRQIESIDRFSKNLQEEANDRFARVSDTKIISKWLKQKGLDRKKQQRKMLEYLLG